MTNLTWRSPKLNTRTITLAAMLIALHTVLSKLSFGSDSMVKIGIGFIGTTLIGYYLGPWLGGISLVLADLIKSTIFATGSTFFIGYTFSAFISGVIVGAFLYQQKITWQRLAIYQFVQTRDAIANGASEIDMVINIGWMKDKKFDLIEEEIRTLKAACGEKILKVIIETCLLTDEEKIKMCEIVTVAGADYIKTSTGFSSGGATFDDVRLFAENVGPKVKIKAAGGIASMDDAQKFLSLGADRLGTSRIIKIVKNEEASGY